MASWAGELPELPASVGGYLCPRPGQKGTVGVGGRTRGLGDSSPQRQEQHFLLCAQALASPHTCARSRVPEDKLLARGGNLTTMAGAETSGPCCQELQPSPMGQEADPLRVPPAILGVPPGSSAGASRGPQERERPQAQAR